MNCFKVSPGGFGEGVKPLRVFFFQLRVSALSISYLNLASAADGGDGCANMWGKLGHVRHCDVSLQSEKVMFSYKRSDTMFLLPYNTREMSHLFFSCIEE